MTPQQRELCEELKLRPRQFAILRAGSGYTTAGHEHKNADGLFTSLGFSLPTVSPRALQPLSDLVRLAPCGKQVHEVNGVEILNDGTVRHVADLGWSDAEWAAAARDPFLTADGRVISKDAARAAAASLRTPAK
ncbi:MAG: hypothetical protein WEB59_01975 [Thermoanaerobaculia bacterium]